MSRIKATTCGRACRIRTSGKEGDRSTGDEDHSHTGAASTLSEIRGSDLLKAHAQFRLRPVAHRAQVGGGRGRESLARPLHALDLPEQPFLAGCRFGDFLLQLRDSL
jgi:hypothetical protein